MENEDGQRTGPVEQGSAQAQEGEAQDQRRRALQQELGRGSGTAWTGGGPRAAKLALLARRAPGGTICPSEVARALAGPAVDEAWRNLMPAVHAAAAELAAAGAVRLSWRGGLRDPGGGPYRIGRPAPPLASAAPLRFTGRTARREQPMAGHRIYTTRVASVYPHYLAKAEKKGRSRAEVDAIFCWLTGHSAESLQAALDAGTDFHTFFADAPALNPARMAVTRTICGVRVEAIEEPLMREIRILDKMVDELARGRPMTKILRAPPAGGGAEG